MISSHCLQGYAWREILRTAAWKMERILQYSSRNLDHRLIDGEISG